MVLRRSSSTPIKPATPMIDEPISKYRQPLRPGPLSSPTILPFEIGSTITDSNNGLEYQLVQPLGNGSYAVVYMVHEKSTNQFYALKCLSKADLNDFHLEVQRNEVFLHEKLSHPNIVRLEHYFETSEWLFLVLEYCEGQDLYFWLTQNNDNVDPKTGRYLSENERMNLVKHVFIQILEAVGYCHSKGIAHRDLKPENFIVMIANNNNRNKDNGLGCSCVVSGCSNDDIDNDNDNNNVCRFADIQIKLTDFGLATEDDESIDFDCGSKPYMSYECRNPINETYNPRLADIWSLGIIFLNLIYHRSPWNDPNPDRCKSFASFQLDKIGFLMQEFPKIPKKIAYFLANYVFNNSPEKGRIEIDQWKIWCDDLDEKLNTVIDEDESHRLPPDSDSSDSSKDNSKEEEDDKYNVNYDGDDDSWSDILGEFVKELNINENDDDFNDDKIEIINNNNIGNDDDDVNAPQHLEFVTTADDDDDDSNAAANNSDADSGFGTDEDTNSNIIKRLQIINNHRHIQQQQEENSPKIATNSDNIVASNVYDTINSDDKVTIATLSTTPPRIIICKPKPWDEPSPRTPRGINDGDGHHHHHHDDTPSRSPPATFNDHWSSSNQRRERVEKRRKEKQGQLFSSWGANRRRGSLTNNNNNNNNNEPTPPSPWDSSFNNNRYNQVEPPVTPTRRQYHHFNNKPYNNHYNNNESLSANNKSRNITTSKRSAPSISPHHHAPRKTKSSQSIKNSYRSSSPTKTTVYYHPYQSKGTTGSTTPKKIDKNNDNNNNNTSNGPSKVTFSTVTTAATSKTGSLTISSRVDDDDDDNEKISPRSPPSSPKYYFDKTPKKKVAKSTKINLSKMLTGVVMFNRSVKVGGREHNDFEMTLSI